MRDYHRVIEGVFSRVLPPVKHQRGGPENERKSERDDELQNGEKNSQTMRKISEAEGSRLTMVWVFELEMWSDQRLEREDFTCG